MYLNFSLQLNLVPYFVIVIIMIFTLKHLKNEVLPIRNNYNKNLIICLMLRSLTQFFILICYWILLYIPSKNGILYHAFQFLNSQQGTFIFLIHCLINAEVSNHLTITYISEFMPFYLILYNGTGDGLAINQGCTPPFAQKQLG